MLVVSVAGCDSGSSEEEEEWLTRFSTKCVEFFSDTDCADLRQRFADDGTWESKTVDQVICEHQQREFAFWMHLGNPTEEQIAAYCDPSNPMFGPSGN